MRLKRIQKLFASFPRGIAFLGVVNFLLCAGPASALTITQNANIATGQTAFGPAITLINWTNFFPPATAWTFGVLPPGIEFGSGQDPITLNTVTGLAGNVNIRNWIDGNGFNQNGVGFNAPNGDPAPDLALNGVETFSLQLTNAVETIGLAIATGLGILPTEVDHDGTSFLIMTNTGDQGTLTLVDSGLGYSAWVTIKSPTPFLTLTFSEQTGNINDQYFGNIFTPVAVPEPSTWFLYTTGLAGLLGYGWRQRKQGGARRLG